MSKKEEEQAQKAEAQDKQTVASQLAQQQDAPQGKAAWAREKLDIAEARANRYFEADEEVPLSKHIILIMIAVFWVFFLAWSNVAKLDEVTRGTGKVIPPSELQVLQSKEGGIIDKIHVRVTQEVKKGQVLISLRDVSSKSELGSANAKFLGLKAKAARLKAEAEKKAFPTFDTELIKSVPDSVRDERQVFEANQESYKSQVNVMTQKLAQREQEVRETQNQISDLREVIQLSEEEAAVIRPLVEKGSAPKVELIQLERAKKQQESELNSLLGQLPRLRSAVKEEKARLSELEKTTRAKAQAELSDVQLEMSTINERLTDLEDRDDRNEIRSNVDGLINEIYNKTEGGVLNPGDDVVSIIPDEDQLVIEARIRPQDRSFLIPGQKVVVKITAYDFSVYGGLEGELIEISPDTITDENGDSYFHVKVRTDQTNLERNGSKYDIKFGMEASIDVLTGKKTVMQYLAKPFIKTLQQGMNER